MVLIPRPFHYCSACGSPYDDAQLGEFVLPCTHCKHTHYRNPAPVANLLVPHENGVIMIRRGIEPAPAGGTATLRGDPQREHA